MHTRAKDRGPLSAMRNELHIREHRASEAPTDGDSAVRKADLLCVEFTDLLGMASTRSKPPVFDAAEQDLQKATKTFVEGRGGLAIT